MTSFASTPLSTRLQAAASTCSASRLGSDIDRFARPLRGFHESDAGLDFDVIADQDFLLEAISTSCTSTASERTLLSGKCGKDILEVDPTTESTESALATTAET